MKIYFCPECGEYTLGPTSVCEECHSDIPDNSSAEVTEEEVNQLEYVEEFDFPPQEGDPRSIYARPANRFVSQFIGVANLLHGTVTDVADAWQMVEISNGAQSFRFQCVSPGAITRGEAVQVSIRPEHIRLLSEAPPGTATNCIEGEVVATVFLGNYIDCRVQWGTVEWKVQVERRQRLRRGMRVWLLMPPQHCLCLQH